MPNASDSRTTSYQINKWAGVFFEWTTQFQSKITRKRKKFDSRNSRFLYFHMLVFVLVCMWHSMGVGCVSLTLCGRCSPRSFHLPVAQFPSFPFSVSVATCHFPMLTALGGTFNTTWVTFYGQAGTHLWVCVLHASMCVCEPGISLVCFVFVFIWT